MLPGGEGSWAYGSSADGAAIAGGACGAECLTAQPFRWLAPGGPLEGLGSLLGAGYSYGYGVSGDGLVVVGYGLDWNYSTFPIRWTEEAGVVAMQRLSGAAYAYAASADGSVMVGRAWDAEHHEQAVAWAADGTVQPLGFLTDPGDNPRSRAHALSPDGRIVAGVAYGAIAGGGYAYQGFRWTAALGMIGLGVEGPDGNLRTTSVLDTSAAGTMLVGAWGGAEGTGEGSRAAIWLQGEGWRDLGLWLAEAHGLDEALDWELAEASAISDDGSVIGGWGTSPAGKTEGFVVTLPSRCVADFNGDGAVNTLDVLAFLNAWVADDPRSDINGDGAVNTLDVIAFLNAWNVGC
ncbi:MAG: hypothetical protein IPJ41_00170 [Phycisphaerales bacterium]|nr:hypothetical protein [Phycisphaerales bacterium]